MSDVVTYTITLDNAGDGVANGVMMDDTLPPKVSFGGWVQQNSAQESDNTISWMGDISGGSQVSIIFTVNITDVSSAGKTVTNTAQFDSVNAGSGSDDAVFTVMYGEEEPLVDPPLDPVSIDETSSGGTFTVLPGDFVEITLMANPSAGLLWQSGGENTGRAQAGPPVFREAQTLFDSENYGKQLVGGVTSQTIRLYPLQAGETTVNLTYGDTLLRRPDQVSGTLTVQLKAEGSFDDAYTPSDPPRDTAIPPLWSAQEQVQDNMRAPAAQNDLPTTFNWCTVDNPSGQDKCTSIKSQSPCGNCWTFAINGATEAVINIKGGGALDLSEQLLTNCNTSDRNCNSGGWWSHGLPLYKDEQSLQNGGPGVVYETDFPYQGQDVACPAGLVHNQTIVDWEELFKWQWTGTEWIKPPASVNDIKQAIQTYGPVPAAVCVGSAFQAYREGIFDTDEKADCGGSINHAVVLTGWDDTEGVWYLRNSWGTWWGEDGNMRIKYGVSNIGEGTAYIVYQDDGSGGPTLPSAPSDLDATAYGNQIALTWIDKSDNETGFEIERLADGNWTQLTSVAANTAAFTDTSGVCNTIYQYRVRAINNDGASEFSNIAQATTGGCANLETPTDFSAMGLSNQIELEWTNPNTGDGGAEVWRWNSGEEEWEKLPTVTDSAAYIDSNNLLFGQSYYYQIRAVQGTDHSNFAEQTSAKLVEIQVNSPTELQATHVAIGQVRLSWTNNSSLAEKIVVQRWNASTSQWVQIADVPAADASGAYTDTNLSCNTYSYQVAAQVSNVTSNYSNMDLASVTACNVVGSMVYLLFILK